VSSIIWLNTFRTWGVLSAYWSNNNFLSVLSNQASLFASRQPLSLNWPAIDVKLFAWRLQSRWLTPNHPNGYMLIMLITTIRRTDNSLNFTCRFLCKTAAWEFSLGLSTYLLLTIGIFKLIDLHTHLMRSN